ncbi:MAG TPA: hypothetical protein VIW80_18545 [Pyrinomonadaceae bacterium]
MPCAEKFPPERRRPKRLAADERSRCNYYGALSEGGRSCGSSLGGVLVTFRTSRRVDVVKRQASVVCEPRGEMREPVTLSERDALACMSWSDSRERADT